MSAREDHLAPGASTGGPLLRLEGVALDGPDGAPLLSGLDLVLEGGQVLQLHGPVEACAAALRCCAGLGRPRAGVVRLLGEDPGALPRQAASRLLARIGWLPRQGALLANLTLRENLRLPLEFHGAAAGGGGRGGATPEALEAAALARFGLAAAPDLRPELVPLPVRRRVALARAVLLDPALLLLDDPLDDLDEVAAAALARALVAWAAEPGHALLVASPDPTLAAQLGGRRLDLQVTAP